MTATVTLMVSRDVLTQQLAAVQAIADNELHLCWWHDNAGQYEGCDQCMKCRLDVAIGGTDANGWRE